MYKNLYARARTHTRTYTYRVNVLEVEEGKGALGKLLSGVIGSGSCVASCSPHPSSHVSLSLLNLLSLLRHKLLFGQRGYIVTSFLSCISVFLYPLVFQFFPIYTIIRSVESTML